MKAFHKVIKFKYYAFPYQTPIFTFPSHLLVVVAVAEANALTVYQKTVMTAAAVAAASAAAAAAVEAAAAAELFSK